MDEEEVIKDKSISFNDGLIQVFKRMFIGLLITAGVAYYAYNSGMVFRMPYGLLALTELIVVFVFSLMFQKLSPTMVTLLFYGYAVLNGLTMSCIFAVYTAASISSTFLITALLFGALALYGKTAKTDLSRFSTIFSVTLIVGIIVSLINIFLNIPLINTILDWAMLILFMGLTAYDIQKFVNLQQSITFDTDKYYVYFAMELYLDFINIFIRLLSIFGRRRN